jgi:hypothetical protein
MKRLVDTDVHSAIDRFSPMGVDEGPGGRLGCVILDVTLSRHLLLHHRPFRSENTFHVEVFY